MEQTILSVAGKPGLYKLVSRGNMKLIVEALDGTKHRIPVFATDRITSLSDITMFTESEDLPLLTILGRLRDKEGGKECSINWRKASPKELQDYFASFVPDFDRDRVHNSDIKKYCCPLKLKMAKTSYPKPCKIGLRAYSFKK